MAQLRRYKLGQIEIDELARRIRSDDSEVAVEPKVFDLLVHFAHRPGQVLRHQELLEAVWGRSIASDAVVSQAIFKLRKLLSGEGRLPDALVTLRGVGFRLDAEPEALENPLDAQTDDRSTRFLDWRIALPLALLIASVLVWWQTWQLAEQAPPRIALLDIENATGDNGLDWVEAGATAMLSEQLTRRGIEVVSARELARLESARQGASTPVAAAATAGASQVFAPRLVRDGSGYRLELASLEDGQSAQLELTGSGPASLSLAMADMLAEELRAPLPPPAGGLGLNSPFLDEAYARAYHHSLTGNHEEAIRLYEAILAEQPEAHWASYHLSIAVNRTGDVDRARALLESLLERPLADAWLAAAVRSSLGNQAWYAGDYTLAERYYQQAQQRFSENNLLGGVASTLGNLGMLALSQGDFDSGRQNAERALEIYRNQGNWVQTARVLHNIGYSYFDQGLYEQALERLDAAYSIRIEHGLLDQAANTRAVIAEIAIEQGRFEEGQRLLEQSLADFQVTGNERRRGQTLDDLADVALRRGHFHRARDYGLEALALANGRDEPTSAASASMTVGRAMHALGDFLGAEEHYRRAGEKWAQVDNEAGQLSSLGERARLALDRGNDEHPRALALIEAMGERAEQLDDHRYRLFHRSLRAQWSIVQGRADDITDDLDMILGDAGERDALRAVLIAEVAERLYQAAPNHEQMTRIWPVMKDWAPRLFPAARLLYLAAESSEECRSAIQALRQLRGPDWQQDLAPSLNCPVS